MPAVKCAFWKRTRSSARGRLYESSCMSFKVFCSMTVDQENSVAVSWTVNRCLRVSGDLRRFMWSDCCSQGKSILKRRVRNVNKPVEVEASSNSVGGEDCASNACKRNVTFDETITVKNDKDWVVKKPLKLELVIDNWKSSNAKTQPEAITPDPGIVKRLVGEFNTIDDVST